MQRISSFMLLALAAFVVFLSASCDPVDCPDGLIPIDDTDATAPEVYWRVTAFTMTPDGPISSITMLNEFENTYEMGTNELVTVFLIAEDNESGVLSINVTGGFGFTCQQDGGGVFIADGIVPGNQINFTNSMTCGTPEGAYQVIEIDGADLCSGPDLSFVNGVYGFDGISENNANDLRLTRLVINVNPHEL
jgi:hypothetical protein